MPNYLEVFCDFDGTITERDTIDVLLSELASPEWEAIEELWVAGEIGSRECMARQIPLIQGGWKAVRAILDEVKLDPYFAEFADFCRAERIPLVVVSDGLDRVIGYVLDNARIRVDKIIANRLVDNGSTLAIEACDGPRIAGCQSGVCKCKVVQAAPQVVRVVIGDGRSDFCWARHADLLFAKGKLADFCVQERVAANKFHDFSEIKVSIKSYMAGSSRHLVFNNVVAPSWQPVLI